MGIEIDKAIILHSVEDATHCVQNYLYKDALLFSTHSSVDTYLREVYAIDSQCLSKLFTVNEIVSFKENLSDDVDKLLQTLDEKISPLINCNFNISMRYFAPLYSYFGKYHYSGYVFLVAAIRKIIKEYKPREIILYDCNLNKFFDADTGMEYITSLVFGNIDTKIITHAGNKKIKTRGLRRLLNIFIKIKRDPFCAYRRMLERLFDEIKYKFSSKNKKTVILFEDLNELWFLKKGLNNYNILYYKNAAGDPSGFKNKTFVCNVSRNLLDAISAVEGPDDLSRVFLKDIKEDFSKNIVSYLNSILLLDEIIKENPLSLAIWGNPPIAKTKALIFEFLRSKNIKILGAQHGCIYGEALEPWHFDSDFNRCDYFVSYGFTRDDLKRLYPTCSTVPKILPVGKVTAVTAQKIKRNIDILFPITNSSSLFSGGFLRIPPDKLTERQTRLLEYLNSLQNINVCVKPFAYSNYENCSVLPVLKRLRNLKVIYDMTLDELLKHYHPRSVLIEYPSQPLVEVLHLDTEIFLMNDCLHPYDMKVLGELQKRVHYSENVEVIIDKITLFKEGRLEKKRDNTYYNNYVYKENAQENILRLIDQLILNCN